MPDKPKRASDYPSEQVELVRATCLYVATKLGDLMDDLVIVGVVVLKALAFDGRGENKDAYDLYYVIRNYGSGVDDVVAKLQPLLGDAEAQQALEILR